MIPHLDLKLVNEPYLEELQAAAARVIASGRYIGGGEVERLENAVALRCGVPHAVGVANGLDALRLILMAYKVMGMLADGDEVIVPANTYIASFLAVSQAGLVPVAVDPDPVTMNLTASGVRDALTERTKGVMPVHLYGRVAWSDELARVATDHRLLVVEDCAQALGARSGVAGLFDSRMAGGLGHAAGISFYPTKNLGALGDGGMVLTHDAELARTVRALANYGSTERYHNQYIGLNSRLDPIQAAMLMVKINHLDEVNRRRAEIARKYSSGVVNPLIELPLMPAGDGLECVWHQYVVRVPEHRDRMKLYLDARGVGTDVHYPCPPHLQPCYRELKHSPLPVAERLAGEVLSLPIGQYLSDEDVDTIVNLLDNFR